MTRTVKTMREKLTAAWGENPAAWLVALADAADERGTKPVAESIGYSPSLISAVVNGSYNGQLKHVEKAVREALLRGVVGCPVLGEITGEKCAIYQRRKLAATNPAAIRLFKACRSGCKNSSLKVAS